MYDNYHEKDYHNCHEGDSYHYHKKDHKSCHKNDDSNCPKKDYHKFHEKDYNNFYERVYHNDNDNFTNLLFSRLSVCTCSKYAQNSLSYRGLLILQIVPRETCPFLACLHTFTRQQHIHQVPSDIKGTKWRR